MAFKEYKVIHVAEGGCGTILLGASGMPLKKLEDMLNEEAAVGWQVVFMVMEQKRFMLFCSAGNDCAYFRWADFAISAPRRRTAPSRRM